MGKIRKCFRSYRFMKQGVETTPERKGEDMPKFLGFRLSPYLVIHRDGQFSVHVKRGRKYRWEHNCEEISERQFKHLYPEEQVRLRKLEEQLGRKLVMPYEVGPDGVTIVWEAKKRAARPRKEKNRS